MNKKNLRRITRNTVWTVQSMDGLTKDLGKGPFVLKTNRYETRGWSGGKLVRRMYELQPHLVEYFKNGAVRRLVYAEV